MKKNNAFRRAAALMAALSITVSLAAPAFAGTYYIDNGDITITKNEDGSQTIKQGVEEWTDKAGEETVITTSNTVITTLESDLEGPAAEDSDFGPVVEDNYQPAQPESTEESEDADRPEIAEEAKSADQHESAEQAQPQQAAPAAAPAASTPKNDKGNGFWGNTITVINKAATALKLTLKDVKIDVSDDTKTALSVQGDGNVEIELDGNNELKGGYEKAGLEKNTSAGTLTLKDDNKKAGSLTATGGYSGAGIGGSNGNGTNNITITGGTVNAAGGDTAAGIGGGQNGNGEDITIKGGTVDATGGDNAAGIGGGQEGSGNNITITGGSVTASGGYGGAGIGGGSGGYGGTGIGGGGENITITGGTVNAAGGVTAAGIGGGLNGSGENITITGGSVNAAGGLSSAGIGGGQLGSGEDITITGGTVNAAGGDNGAGIGGGEQGNGKNITINGGTVSAAGGGNGGAGIGGGISGNGEDITITGGTVNAAGGNFGAGIGGGIIGNGENITITGGTVTAAGGDSGAGIGGGLMGNGSKVTVSGAAQVTTTAGKSDGAYGAGATIGSGGNSTPEGELVDGKEIQADISHLTPGYIHHILYNPDGTTIKREWWEPVRTPLDGESLDLHVETLKGAPLPFNIRQQGSTLRVTTDNLSARLHGTRQALETLQEQGVEQIQFVTTLKTTTLSVAELLAEGGSWFALEHDGLGSRRLSAAQAESLKCWRH